MKGLILLKIIYKCIATYPNLNQLTGKEFAELIFKPREEYTVNIVSGHSGILLCLIFYANKKNNIKIPKKLDYKPCLYITVMINQEILAARRLSYEISTANK